MPRGVVVAEGVAAAEPGEVAVLAVPAVAVEPVAVAGQVPERERVLELALELAQELGPEPERARAAPGRPLGLARPPGEARVKTWGPPGAAPREAWG